jgi:hypothetical protein
MLVSWLAYSSILQMEATRSSETSGDFQQTYISKDRTLHNHWCENLKSYNLISSSTICLSPLYHITVKTNDTKPKRSIRCITDMSNLSWWIVLWYNIQNTVIMDIFFGINNFIQLHV